MTINLQKTQFKMHKSLITIFLLRFGLHISAKEVYYDLKASYFDGAPDGVPKSILGFNEMFPGPTIRASKYDILTIKVTNLIQDFQTTTIHWHGLEQFLTPFQDGPRMLTQCDIPYNVSYTYQFQVNQTGTYWYHAHHTSQYSEGLWGVLIVDNTPEVHKYDGEFLLTLSDWYHPPAQELSEWYEDPSKSKGGLPFPDSALINGEGYYPCEYANRKNKSCNPSFSQRYKLLEVERGKTYRFRVVNPATLVLYAFSIDGHKLEMIETDGVDTVRVAGVDWAKISTGSRSSFLVKMDGDLDQYWIRSWADLAPYKLVLPNINPFPEAHWERETTLAVLRYKEGPIASTSEISESGSLVNPNAVQGRPESHDSSLLKAALESGTPNFFNLARKASTMERVDGQSFYKDPIFLPIATPPFPPPPELDINPDSGTSLDQMDCIPFDTKENTAPTYVNQTIYIEVPYIDHPDNGVKVGFNNISFDTSTLDKPALIKMLLSEGLPESLHPIVINGFGEDYVVELIINDYGDTGHPLHLHGHTFWVMGYGKENDGPFDEERHRPTLRSGVRRETMAVQPNSWLVLRFRADSPGLWLFHCHMNFHFETALGLVFVEGTGVAKDLFAKRIPQSTIELCRHSKIEVGGSMSSMTTFTSETTRVLSSLFIFMYFSLHDV